MPPAKEIFTGGTICSLLLSIMKSEGDGEPGSSTGGFTSFTLIMGNGLDSETSKGFGGKSLILNLMRVVEYTSEETVKFSPQFELSLVAIQCSVHLQVFLKCK